MRVLMSHRIAAYAAALREVFKPPQQTKIF
jgi:hypothetical protein